MDRVAIEDFQEAFKSIGASSLDSLRNNLYRSACLYAQCRSEWYFMNTAERLTNDASRSAAHEVFIDACNILSRNMAKAGESIDWRRQIGTDRKSVGDFACFVQFQLTLASR